MNAKIISLLNHVAVLTKPCMLTFKSGNGPRWDHSIPFIPELAGLRIRGAWKVANEDSEADVESDIEQW